MKISLFDYELPEARIAQYPEHKRDDSRLLVLNRKSGSLEHRRFHDLTDYVRRGDVFVFNDSKVIHARLIGVKAQTAARVEVFLVRRLPTEHPGADVWETLVRPGKRLHAGDTIVFSNDFSAEIAEKTEDGGRVVRFSCTGNFDETVERLGYMPLPPYIRRAADANDDVRYQTIYARTPGSVAAPTAGLHFTEALLEAIRAKGAQTVFVTLHVGLGTFRPVKTERVEAHHMHSERYFIGADAAGAINAAKRDGRRVVCVGTTAVRTLESAAQADERVKDVKTQSLHSPIQSGEGETDIFIYPGYAFKGADALVTNFHLPKSTLLMLVSAFAGRERVLEAYAEALAAEYRFFSYGDAMLIV